MFSLTSQSLIVYQIIAHVAFIFAIYYGNLHNWLAAFLVYAVLATVGGTITYHRLISHRAFKSPKWFEYLGCILGSLGGNGSPLAWAAIHREHHRFTDTEKDPHSPLFKSIFRIQFASMLDKPNLKYAPDLLRSKFHLALHKYYWAINFLYIIITYLMFGFTGVLFGYLVPTLLVWHAGSLINTVNHLYGYTNHKLTNSSTNNLFTGFLVAGEGWHNNHHANPADPCFGKKWWEFDLGYQIIKIIKK